MLSTIDYNSLHKLEISADLSAASFSNAVNTYYDLVKENKNVSYPMEDYYREYFKLYVGLDNIGHALASLPVSQYKRIAIDPTLTNDAWYIAFTGLDLGPVIGVYSEGV